MPSPSGRILDQQWVLIADSTKAQFPLFFPSSLPLAQSFFFEKKMDDDAQTHKF
jgi:hypothetical protein